MRDNMSVMMSKSTAKWKSKWNEQFPVYCMQTKLWIIHSTFCEIKIAIFTLLSRGGATAREGALICTDSPCSLLDSKITRKLILPTNIGYFLTRLKKYD